MTSSDTLGLYLHVPFCAAKCPYCDFYSVLRPAQVPAYVAAVKEELTSLRRAGAYVTPAVFSRPLKSVYFGGGTPGLLPAEDIASILQTVRDRYALEPGAEITLECNPMQTEPEPFFSAVAAAGVNRVSVGLQSAVENERRALGRRGTPAEAERVVKAAAAAGIGNISLDLMLGIPGQTKETLRLSLDFALSLRPAHLSLYILKIEEGTPFYKRRERLSLPDEDETAELYLFACTYLRAAGMRHYEISNFCFDDRVGAHNLRYWQCEEYLGVGPAAHSFVNGRRFYYPRDLDAFLAGEAPLPDGDGGTAEEYLMLSLRTDLGLPLAAFQARCGVAPGPGFYKKLEEYAAYGLLHTENGTVRFTDRGFLVSNTMLSALLAEL